MKRTPFYEEETSPWHDPLAPTEETPAVPPADTGRHLWAGIDQSARTRRLDDDCAIAAHSAEIEGMTTTPPPSKGETGASKTQ